MVSQAMMSLVGHEIPLGRSTADQELRFEVFDIIHPYCLSPEDMEIVNGVDSMTKVLWLETFTNTQKGLLGTSLFALAMSQFRTNFFPSNGAYPASDFAEMIGLPPGKSILNRLVLI
jgi:hypothetical protein